MVKSLKMTEKMREKYRPFIDRDGGIFTASKRRRLLRYSPGRRGYSEEDATFRYDVRRFVKQALVDLELFIEVADKKDMDKVLNSETLRPIVEALLWHPVVEQAEPDLTRAEIAQSFIQAGFDYLSSMKIHEIPSLHQRVISEAIELSHLLVKSFKVGGEGVGESSEG